MRGSGATGEQGSSCLQTFLEYEYIVSITFLTERVRLRVDNGQQYKRQKNDATATRESGHRNVSRRGFEPTSMIKRAAGAGGDCNSDRRWLDDAAKMSCDMQWNQDAHLHHRLTPYCPPSNSDTRPLCLRKMREKKQDGNETGSPVRLQSSKQQFLSEPKHKQN